MLPLQTSSNTSFSIPLINRENNSPPTFPDTFRQETEKEEIYADKPNHASSIDTVMPHQSKQNLLIDPESGAILPSNLKLATMPLFMVYAQNGVDQAIQKKQDLIEWLENTLKMFESCQTIRFFFECFDVDIISQFPDLFSIVKKLKNSSEKLLNGVDAFPLLESLKQSVSDSIVFEVSRIISNRQAQNARELRRRNQKKAEVDEKCQKLMKETGISPKESNVKEMAAAAWQYMIHNLPVLLDDIVFINTAIPLWQNKSMISESEWTKQLLSSLDNPSFPYSTLPFPIKKGLKTYLTSYKTSTDYREHIKLQNSLIGKPQITQFKNGGLSILRITAGYLSVSGLLTLAELANLKNHDEIQIITKKMFLDKNMNHECFRGKNILITGETIDIAWPVVIDTSGLDALPHAEQKARDGKSFSYSTSGNGYNGEDGKPGNPGGSAGNVHIQAGKINGVQRLWIIANGGKGANGQHGGTGDKGQDGQDGEDAEYYSDGSSHHAFRAYHIKRGTGGSLGQAGGNGGDGGKGGQGGYAGRVIVRDSYQDYTGKIKLSAVTGQDGISGEPGEGGEAGYDGRRGLDSILSYKGALTFQKDQYLKGWDVFAKLMSRGWFTKNTYDLFARVSEYIVKTLASVRTKAHGQTGSHAHQKNSAKQKAAINFAAVLLQCPEVATNLSLSDSAIHKQLNQKLETLLVLGDQREKLNNDIQHLENEQKILSEKLKKLEETAQSIAKETLHQRMTQHHQVNQMADPKAYDLPQEKPNPLPKFSFFVPEFDKEEERKEMSISYKLEKVISLHMPESHSKETKDIIILINNRFEKDISKINKACPDIKISQTDVYASLEKLIEMLVKKITLSREDLISKFYEMSLWYFIDPDLIEDIVRNKKDIFDWFFIHPKLLTENKYHRLKFALSFMQLEPRRLAEIRINTNTSKDHEMLNLVNQYYFHTFYKPRKKAVLLRRKQITKEQKTDILINNILFETKKTESFVGYVQLVKTMDMLICHLEQLRNEPHQRELPAPKGAGFQN